MKARTATRFLMVFALASLVWACADAPAGLEPAPPKPSLQFMDLQGFDRDLAQALSAPLPKVEVAFYDRIVPSAMPERLQHWMAAVEAGGGTVKVAAPKSSVSAKSPFLLISAISALWSASKAVKDISIHSQFKAARGYDAEIVLRQDDKGDSVVERVVFTQRAK